MQIKEYLFYNDLSVSDFAKMVDVHRQTLYKIINGQTKNLNTDVVEKIVEGTNGQVTFTDILAESKGKKPTYPTEK